MGSDGRKEGEGRGRKEVEKVIKGRERKGWRISGKRY